MNFFSKKIFKYRLHLKTITSNRLFTYDFFDIFNIKTFLNYIFLIKFGNLLKFKPIYCVFFIIRM